MHLSVSGIWVGDATRLLLSFVPGPGIQAGGPHAAQRDLASENLCGFGASPLSAPSSRLSLSEPKSPCLKMGPAQAHQNYCSDQCGDMALVWSEPGMQRVFSNSRCTLRWPPHSYPGSSFLRLSLVSSVGQCHFDANEKPKGRRGRKRSH